MLRVSNECSAMILVQWRAVMLNGSGIFLKTRLKDEMMQLEKVMINYVASLVNSVILSKKQNIGCLSA